MKRIITVLLVFLSFRVFSLEIQQCIDNASEKNVEIKNAENQIKVSGWELYEANKASLPQASFEFENRNYDTTAPGVSVNPASDDTPKFTLNLSTPLSTDGNLSKNILMKRYQYKKDKLSLDIEMEKLKYNIFLNVLNVVKNNRIYELSKEISQTTDSLVNIFEKTYDLGKISRLDYINAKNERSKIKYSGLMAEKNYYDSYYSLISECNIRETNISEISDIDVDFNFQNNIVDIKENALEKRNELELLEIEAKIREMERELSEPYQKMFLNFEYIKNGEFDKGANEFDFPLKKNGYKYSLFFEKPLNWHKISISRDYEKAGVTSASSLEDSSIIVDKVKFDLFENGSTRSVIEQNRVYEDYAKYYFQDFKNNLLIELEKTYKNLNIAKQVITAQQQVISFYDEKIKIETEKYNLGKFAMYTLLESHVESLQEKQKYIEAFYDYKKAYITLKYLMGEVDEIIY